MKKTIKKSLPLLMAGLMLCASVMPTFATVKEKQTVNTNSNAQTEVFYNQESQFEVILPKLIDLGVDKTTNYTVTVSGDISSDNTVIVVPEESFLMKDISGGGKADVTATVIQDKTKWTFNEFETIGNGNVSAPDLTAGTWEGKFYFNISMLNTEIGVEAKDSEGNNLNASATNITGEEKDNLLSGLVESEFVETIDDVDALISVESDDFDGIAETTFDVSNIAKEGDTVVILHFDEEKQQWEYVGTETVNSEGKVMGDFTSYSPVAFIIIAEDGSYEIHTEHTDIDNDGVCDVCNLQGTIVYTYHTHTGTATTKAGCYQGAKSSTVCGGKLSYDPDVDVEDCECGGYDCVRTRYCISCGYTFTYCLFCDETPTACPKYLTTYTISCGMTEETVIDQTTIFE